MFYIYDISYKLLVKASFSQFNLAKEPVVFLQLSVSETKSPVQRRGMVSGKEDKIAVCGRGAYGQIRRSRKKNGQERNRLKRDELACSTLKKEAAYCS
jgi:hypothetical protein